MVNLKGIVFLTGHPGVGKTTVLLNAVETLKRRGFSVGGMVSREAREGGTRVGFRITDLETGTEGWLAHVRQPQGPKVGKYTVCLEDLESVGVAAILNAVKQADVTVIDEVGPMELSSKAFKNGVTEVLNSGKIVLGTIHHRAWDPLIEAIRRRDDTKIIEVTVENRERLGELIAQEVSESLITIHRKG